MTPRNTCDGTGKGEHIRRIESTRADLYKVCRDCKGTGVAETVTKTQ